jgi:uncharacterized protein with GYD domain
MPKYLAVGSYSTGTWARLVRRMDDRFTIAKTFTHALGGSIESLYWEVNTRSVYAIADMPDSATMAAAAAAVVQTGAFTSVDSHELLSQDQLYDVLAIASDAAQVYEVPGQPAHGAI